MRRRTMMALAVMTALGATTGHAQTLAGTLKKVSRQRHADGRVPGELAPVLLHGVGRQARRLLDRSRARRSPSPSSRSSSSRTWPCAGCPSRQRTVWMSVANGTVDIECGSTTASLSRQEEGRLHAHDVRGRRQLADRRGIGPPHGRRSRRQAHRRRAAAPRRKRRSSTSCAPSRITATDRAREGPRRGARGAPDVRRSRRTPPTARSS